MTTLSIPWHPPTLLSGRRFRLPVQGGPESLTLETPAWQQLGQRYAPRDGARYIYLQAPQQPGRHLIALRQGDQLASVHVQVCDLRQLRQQRGAWPRRWPLGRSLETQKKRQTLVDEPLAAAADEALAYWRSLTDAMLWQQLPPAELPRAHFANVHQGCPQCGTAIFAHGGFYPWRRSHAPIDYRSTCPSCDATFPSNDLAKGDFTSGDTADDGYGYVNEEGHLFLFAATYARDQVRFFGAGIGQLTAALRQDYDPDCARTLALMLLRYAVEIIYLAAVPQFRYGPSEAVEKPWAWGQPNWGTDQLGAKGMLRYCIDVPYISETLALAYDAVWPLLQADAALVQRARALGLDVAKPAELVALVEEMLACQLQCCLDGGARSNLPRVSQAVLVLLRALDRSDGQEVLQWLYDAGPDRLRTFTSNNFFPDGTPPEATGGYNGIHCDGLFDLERHLRHLRALHPGCYTESDFPSLLSDPRAKRVARAPIEIATIGRSWFQFGDGSAPGSAAQLGRSQRESPRLQTPVFHAPMHGETLERALRYTGDPTLSALRDTIAAGRHPQLGMTIHDGVGIAIMRTSEMPERAAAGICYGDTTGHRHMDLLDVQLFAHGGTLLGDLGYPQSWASSRDWEAHWATHNSAWPLEPGLDGQGIAGRGRLLHVLNAPGVQVLDVEAERWRWNDDLHQWERLALRVRRLLALIETDGQGVLLIDLTRLSGGRQHWRLCRGCGPQWHSSVSQKRQTGTLAGRHIERGQSVAVPHPELTALAYMDDVYALPDAGDAHWQGSWAFDASAQIWLDVHALGTSPNTRAYTARSTAVMGTPEASNYNFRTLAWKRDVAAGSTTYVDLAFEPRLGTSALKYIGRVKGPGSAAGVDLCTQAGRRVRLYWSADERGDIAFADGTHLCGALAVVCDEQDQMKNQITGRAAESLYLDGQLQTFEPGATQVGQLLHVDADACTVEVSGLSAPRPGARLTTPARGRSYLVEGVRELGDNRWQLQLDVTPKLGCGRIAHADGHRVMLDAHVLTRTGYLHGAYLHCGDDRYETICHAYNPDPTCTQLHLDTSTDALKPESPVQVLDCAPGDLLDLERDAHSVR